MTPSGRFEANREICLSISGHHEETWQPAWGVRTALVAYVATPKKFKKKFNLCRANVMCVTCRLRSFMETDARGQLGGLETTDAVRQRLAAESPSFKCAACGKTNGEIIKECEERASQASSSAQEVEVPKELNMGWRDEMEAKKKKKKSENKADDDSAEAAELAEGFVQTAPIAAVDNSTLAINNNPPTPTRTTGPNPAPVPAGRAPNAAATVPLPAPGAQRQQIRRASDDGVPVWLDRMIVVLVVLLVALVLKILFAV